MKTFKHIFLLIIFVLSIFFSFNSVEASSFRRRRKKPKKKDRYYGNNWRRMDGDLDQSIERGSPSQNPRFRRNPRTRNNRNRR